MIVGATSGDVTEVFYRDSQPPGQTLLRNLRASAPVLEDASPDEDLGAKSQELSAAGLIVQVVGSEQHLYALSPNAGVWRSDNGQRFVQLSTSPRYGAVIAVDPKNQSHVILGERSGEASPSNLDRTGVWESTDAGDSWSFAFTPLMIGCGSSAVSAVAFDASSNAYVATGCGITRRAATGGPFQTLAGTNSQAFLALAIVDTPERHWLWARTQSTLLLQRSPGGAWENTALPPTAQNLGRDETCLAAFDTFAFVIGSNGGSVSLTFDPDAKQWSTSGVFDGDGTGLGGRRFVKSFFVGQPDRRWCLFAGTGQGVFVGSPSGASITWKRIAESPWPLGPNEQHIFNPTSSIHTDIWDLTMSTSGSQTLWLAGDGGIYETSLPAAAAAPAGTSPLWISRNHGLHTHHVHSMSSLLDGHTRRPRLFYATQDNDAWYSDSTPIGVPAGPWRVWGGLGDTNWTAGDRSNPVLGLAVRNGQDARIIDFGANAPGAVMVRRAQF